MKYALNGKNTKFINRQITSEEANSLFTSLKNAIDTRNNENIVFHLVEFAINLKSYAQENEKEYSDLIFNRFSEINNYIAANIYDKFQLQALSEVSNMNKFGFAKKFKK